LERYILAADAAIGETFLRQLDQFLMSYNAVGAFLDENQLQNCSKDRGSRDIKKFFTRMYKSTSTLANHVDIPHQYEAITPNYLELSNWETCLYLLRVKYKVCVTPFAPYDLSTLTNAAFFPATQTLDVGRGLVRVERPPGSIHSWHQVAAG